MIVDALLKVVRRYFFDSTARSFGEALRANSLSEAAEIIVAASVTNEHEFWLDLVLLVSLTLVFLMIANCCCRCGYWFCYALPKEAHEVELIRQGKKEYQIRAKKEREEKLRREAAGETERAPTAAEDMAALSKVIAEYQESLAQDNINTTAPAQPLAPAAVPASILRGFPEVDVLLTSPAQKYLLVGCRSKRRLSLYPQSEEVSFMTKGKALQESGFLAVETSLGAVLGLERKPEWFSAAFSCDDACLVVTERGMDEVVAFSLTSSVLQPMWHFKMPGRRLVSSLPTWNLLSSDAMICLHDTEASVEVIRASASGQQPHVSTDKFKVGHALAWGQRGDLVAVGGSFLREVRVARITQRGGSSEAPYALQPLCTMNDAAKLKVVALSVVAAGSPAFSTKSYLIVVVEGGLCTVYDLGSLASRNEPQVVATVADPEVSKAAAGSGTAIRIVTAISGVAYHERVHLGLVGGSHMTVFRQEGNPDAQGRLELLRATDLRGMQEGDAVEKAVFIQHGRGVASCGRADGRHVRLFKLPE